VLVRRVRLRNFTSYRDAEIVFPPEAGAVAIVGPNGAGKSSILDAIYYALYGKSLRGNLDETVRAGAGEMEVELLFEASGAKYRVKRHVTLKRRRRHEVVAELTRVLDGGEKLIARGAMEVTKAVKALLGVDETMFLSAYYVRQGEIAALLSMQPGDRKRLVTRLLGIEHFERAYDLMQKLIERFTEEQLRPLEEKVLEKERVDGELRRLRESLEEKVEEKRRLEREAAAVIGRKRSLEEEKRTVEGELSALQENIRSLAQLEAEKRGVLENVRSLEERLRRLEETKERLSRLRKECERLRPFYEGLKAANVIAEKRGELGMLEERLRELEKTLESIPELQRSAEQYLRLKKQYEEIKRRKERYSLLLHELESLAESRKRVERLLRRVEEKLAPYLEATGLSISAGPDELRRALVLKRERLEEKIGELKKRFEKIREEVEALKARLEQVNKWVRELEEISEPRCPLCGRPLDEQHKKELHDRYVSEARSLSDKLRERQREASELEKELEEYERVYRELLRLDPDEGSRLVGEYSRYREELRELEDAIDEKRREIGKMKDVDERLRELERMMEDLESMYMSFLYYKEKRPEYERELARLRERILDIREQLGRAEEKLRELGLLGKSLEEIREGAERYVTYSASIKELEGILGGEGEIVESLNAARRRLAELEAKISTLKPVVERAAVLEKKRGELEKELRELGQKEGMISGRLEALRETIGELERKIGEYEDMLREIEAYEKKLIAARRVLEDLEKIRTVFHKDGAPKRIREKAIPRIQRLTKEFLEFFNLEIGDIVLKDDFSVAILEGGRERRITTLSGGEQVVTALSLRLAIARNTIDTHSLLMFDEPTANLDEERRRLLVDAMKRLYREGGGPRQMIIVTHDRELEDAADKVYRVKRLPTGSVIEELGLDSF